MSSEEPTPGFSGSRRYNRKDRNSDDVAEYVKVTANQQQTTFTELSFDQNDVSQSIRRKIDWIVPTDPILEPVLAETPTIANEHASQSDKDTLPRTKRTTVAATPENQSQDNVGSTIERVSRFNEDGQQVQNSIISHEIEIFNN